MTPHLWRQAGGLVLLCALLAFSPSLYGLLTAPKNTVFIGLGGVDEYNHLAWIAQAVDGHLLFKSPYVLGERSRVVFLPFYLLVGRLALITHIFPPLLFTLLRLPLQILFFAVVFAVVAYFTRPKRMVLPMFLLVALGGGLGWLDWANPNPDLVAHRTVFTMAYIWVEGNTFYTAKQDQAAILTFSFLVAAYGLFLSGYLERRWRRVAAAAAAAAGAFLIQPFMVLSVYVVVFLFILLVNRRRHQAFLSLSRYDLRLLLTFYLLSFPPVFYYLMLIWREPMFSVWAMSQYLPKPAAAELMITYGLILIPFLAGVKKIIVSRSPRELFLLSWFFGSLLVFVGYPYNFSRRLLMTSHIPLVLIAGCGWRDWLPAGRRGRIFFWSSLLLLLTPFTFYVLWRDYAYLSQRLPDNYLPRDTVKAALVLRHYRGHFDETVYGSHFNAQAAAALAGHQVFAGSARYCLTRVLPPSAAKKRVCPLKIMPPSLHEAEAAAALSQMDVAYLLIDKHGPLRGRSNYIYTLEVLNFNQIESFSFAVPLVENGQVMLYRTMFPRRRDLTAVSST